MKTSTPFFPGFHRILFGRAQRCAQAQLRSQAEAFAQASLCQLSQLFSPWLPQKLLHPAPRGLNSRQRSYALSVTFWAFLAQVLSPGSPCREIVRKVQAWSAARRRPIPSSATGAYCRARARLPQQILHTLHQHTASELQRRITTAHLWRGRHVKVVDATGVSMPDTPSNQKVFPQPANQKTGCGFPVAKLVGCFCLASGALLSWAEGTLYLHENHLFRQLFKLFRKGDVILTDRGFCSYANIASLLLQGVDSVMRLHQARSVDFRKGKRLGPKDRLVLWHKPPQRPHSFCPSEWNSLPSSLTLRLLHLTVSIPGFRPQSIILVTTLTDPLAYPALTLAQLYLRRWSVELFFRDIKITLGMDVLRCLSPQMVRKEIALHAIAYNLIRALMQQAAAAYHAQLSRISFKGSVDTLRQWIDTLNAHGSQPRQQARLFLSLLHIIAQDIVPHRPYRSEPRVRKRRPKNYRLMTRPRRQYQPCIIIPTCA
jgi:hypothetical protein